MIRSTLFHARLALPVLLLALVAACATQPMPASVQDTPIDLQRYMGRWYVIARVPYFAERGHVAGSVVYTLRGADGGEDKLDIHYTYRTGFAQEQESLDSVATVQPGTGNRVWTQRFYRVIPAKYRILEVAPDYSWALVDYPGRDLAWILGREPIMSDAVYAQLLGKMRNHGVNEDKLWRIPQTADQIGKLGFDEPGDP